MKFLVVDDSRLARKKIITYISKLGYEVVGEAIDGYDAIEKVDILKPTCITMDLEMPKLNGVEAIREIMSTNPTMKIILITSVVNKTEVITAIKLGAKSCLKKPITLDMLASELKKIDFISKG